MTKSVEFRYVPRCSARVSIPAALAAKTLSTPEQAFFIVAGALIIAFTIFDLVRTLVVTRSSHTPITALVRRVVEGSVSTVARRFKSYEQRDYIRTWTAALILLTLLAAWLLCFLVGYAFLLHAVAALDMPTAFREAGSSLFTLGFASADRDRLSPLDFIAAATGPITIALMISYLPAIYSAYNVRELDVALLKSRFGEPNWGPEILARHVELGDKDERMGELWRTWEAWAANVSETHTTYRVLIFTRSSRPSRNWLVALLSVMDSAALTLALKPQHHHPSCRGLLNQGIDCINELSRTIGLKLPEVRSGSSPIGLHKEDFLSACKMMTDRGYRAERPPEQSWESFRNWRRLYEAQVYALALRIDAVPALWSGPRIPATPQVAPIPKPYEMTGDGDVRYPVDQAEVSRISPNQSDAE